jgi:hypothetical protein
MKHHYPNCDLGDRCNCQEIDDIEQEQITTMNNDTPRTNDIIEQIKGFRTSSAIYSLEQFSRLLERELTAVTEQRDRLAEALVRIANNDVLDMPETNYAYQFGRMEGIAKTALQSLTPDQP